MEVMSAFYKTTPNPLTAHHHESYEKFIGSIPQLIRKYANPIRFRKTDKEIPLSIEVFVGTESGDKIFLTEPKFAPSIARATSTNYEFLLSADITVKTSVISPRNGKPTKIQRSETYESVVIGNIPLMTKSKWCVLSRMSRDEAVATGEDPDDTGGYFIADGGMDKVVVSQWKDADNSLTIQRKDVPADASPASWNDVLVARTRCVSADGLDHAYIEIRAKRKGMTGDYYFTLSSPVLASEEHELWDVFAALGIDTDRDILGMICGDGEDSEVYRFMMFPSSRRRTSKNIDDAQTNIIRGVEWQADLKKEWMYLLFAQQRIPGVCSDAQSIYTKALGLANMIRQMLSVIVGGQDSTDHDDAKVKRMFTTGRVMHEFFDKTVYLWTNEVRNAITRDYEYTTTKTEEGLLSLINRTSIPHTICPRFISGEMTKFMKGSSNDEDVVQDLSRGMSMLGTMSHLRRLNTPMDRTSKVTSVREVDFQNYGRIDFTETPDGGSIGLLQNLCTMAYVSYGINPATMVPILSRPEYGVSWIHEVSLETVHARPKLFVNGAWWGTVEDPVDVRDRLLDMRRRSKLDRTISVSIRFEDGADVYIYTDQGRIMRPLFVIDEKGRVKEVSAFKTFDEMVVSGAIEYVDVYEESNALVANAGDTKAITSDHTHMEVHPVAVMSIVGANLPLLDHAQAPRAVYACGQIKQSIGRYAGNQHERFDTVAYSLFFPENPVVYTEMENLSGLANTPFGQNIVVGVITSSGHHIEDGIIFNRSSVQRGLFRTLAYKSMRTAEIFEKDARVRIAPTLAGLELREDVDRSHLDEDGIVKVGTVIAKETPTTVVQMEEIYKVVEAEKETWARRDVSLVSDKSRYGRVDRIRTTIHPEKLTRVYRARLCQVREPTIGDKFASRSGQKGTICRLVDERDMPTCPHGLGTPDMLYNPHAFPKRETPNYQIEQLLNMLGICRRERVRADPFDSFDIPALISEMEGYGFTDAGLMKTIDGRTGTPIEVQMFAAPMYYARLKHMVADKMHSRSAGPLNNLTRQPADGRAKDGGFRMGEMEFNALLSHGISKTVQYTTMEKSDGAEFHVCPECSTYLGANQRCDAHPSSVPVIIRHPYAWKLLSQELQAMGIQMRYDTVDPRPTVESEMARDSGQKGDGDSVTPPSLTYDDVPKPGKKGGGEKETWWPFDTFPEVRGHAVDIMSLL